MVGARAPGTEQISHLALYFDVSNAYKKKHRSWPGGQGGKPGPWLQEGGRSKLSKSYMTRLGLGEGPRASVPGG